MPPKKRAAAPSPVPSAATGTPAQAKTLLRRSNETQAARKRSTWKGLFFGLLLRTGIFYTLIAALWHCSSTPFAFDYNPRDSRQVCRTLAQGKATVGPHAAAIWRDVELHLQPYTAPVAPYVRTATRIARPYARSAQRRGAQLWRKHGEPMRKHALKQGRKYVDPHVKTVRTHYRKSVQPHVDTANAAIKPYRDIYSRDVHPYLTEAGALSLGLTQQAYHVYNKQVQPRLITGAKAAHRFHRQHIDPAARRGYSLYVQPQADRLLAYLFNRKARAVSNDAISKAKTSSDEARQQGESKAKEAVKEAALRLAQQASARRAQEDPTLIDRLNKARDAVTGKVPSHEDPVQAAALDAELAAEQETVKTELEAWETGMLKLIEQEYRLVTERVAELRNRRLADLPDRFATLTESFVDDEVASALTRLDRTYKKLSVDSSSATLAERIESGNAQTQAQRTRLSQSLAALEAQLQTYQDELDADERAAIAAGTAEVARFADEAGRAYAQAMKRAKFEVTEEEWSGWDKGLKVRAELFGDECEKLRLGQKSVRSGIGAIDLSKEPKLEPRIAELRKSTAKLYSAADAELASYARSGSLQLRGEGVRRTVGEATDNVQSVAQQLTEGAAAAMLGAAAAARARLGLAPSDQGILARVASQASSAADAATSGAASAAGQARSSARSAASAAGVSVSPEGAREHIESAYGAAAAGAGNVYSSVVAAVQPSTPGAFEAATSSVGSAYESLASAASSASSSYLKPSTTGYFEAATSSVGSVYEELASSAADASSSYLKPSTTGYFEAATSSVGSAYESAASAASSLAGAATTPVAQRVYDAAGNAYSDASASAASVYSDVAAGNVGSSASSALRQATRSVASAAGYSPAPETPGEYLEAGRERVADAAQAVYSAVGGAAYDDSKLPGRHAPREDYNHIGKAAAAGAAKVAEVASPYAEDAASLAREAGRSVASAAGVDVEPTNAAEWVSSAASRATAAVAGAQGGVASSASSLSSVASASISSASKVAASSMSSASSVASASSSSLAKAAASSYSSASKAAASAAGSSPLSSASSAASSASKRAASSASSVSKEAQSSLSAASKAAASAVGDSPLSSASSAVSAAAAAVSSSASSLSSSFNSATRSEKVAMGMSVAPEGAAQSVYSAAAEAASSISSYVQPAAASTGVVDQARSAASSVASRVREEL